MKKNKTIMLVLAFITSLFFSACVEDSDFTVPQNLEAEENETISKIIDSVRLGTLQEKTIKQVKELYIKGNEPIKIKSNIVVVGYVISSDKTGNFYKEFYMQDAPENPTS